MPATSGETRPWRVPRAAGVAALLLLAAYVAVPAVAGDGAGAVADAGPVYSVWPDTAVPKQADAGPDGPVELGMKFRAEVSGDVLGIRFYKHPLNRGIHVGNLWTMTGTRLATARFTSETASGWQEVRFPAPVRIEANVTYVASYFCQGGHYSADLNYFARRGAERPPLRALMTGVDGPNGVFAYGSTSGFPSATWFAANYWVDVVFTRAD